MYKLIQGDCLEVMRKIPDNSIDLIVIDPPYKTITGGDSNGKNSIRPKGVLSGNRKLFKFQNNLQAKERLPELKLMFHIPNGGSRNKIEAANLKRQGVKAGVPDICLPVPRGDYHGLYIEMKYGKNKPTESQVNWLRMLRKNGYVTAVYYSAEVAIRTVTAYLQNKKEI